jgi:hypothetical protein
MLFNTPLPPAAAPGRGAAALQRDYGTLGAALDKATQAAGNAVGCLMT